MTWLWGCMVLALKATFGWILWSLLFIVAGVGLALIGGGLGSLWPEKKKEPEKPEEWKEWADEQDGELKTLLTEIDKDLENENN